MEKTKLLILRLTDRCNLACKYCYAAEGQGACSNVQYSPKDSNNAPHSSNDYCNTACGSDMTPEIARKAIDLFAQPGDKLKIQFTGGEPLLCMELMKEIFHYVKQRGIQPLFSLQTNGTLLTPEACLLLKEMHCAVGVSLDGMGEANSLRVYPNGQEALEEVIAGIRTLRAFSMHCNLNAVVTRINQAYLSQLLELAAYLGNVRGVGLDMFRPLGRGRSNALAPDLKTIGTDIERMLCRSAELSKLGVNIRIKELEKVRVMLRENVKETCYCYAQTGYSAAVDPKGDIYPCSSFVGMQDMCMGNVETGFHFIDKIPGMDGKCFNCADAAICRGGCPAGRVAYSSYKETDCRGRNETDYQSCSEADCFMHRTIIQYGRKEYA